MNALYVALVRARLSYFLASLFMKETEWSWLNCRDSARTAGRPWIQSLSGPFCVEFICSHSVCVGSPQVPGKPATADVCARTRVHRSALGFDRFTGFLPPSTPEAFFFSACRGPPGVSTLQCDDTTRHSGLTCSVYFFLQSKEYIFTSWHSSVRFNTHPGGEGGGGLLRNVNER